MINLMRSVVFIICFFPLLCVGQVTWLKSCTAPIGVSLGTQKFLIDSSWYVQGGEDSSGIIHKSMWQYKIRSNTWIRKNDMDTIEGGRGIAISDTGYVIGGQSNLGELITCRLYYPNIDRWTVIDSLREGCNFGVSFVCLGKVFACMGYNSNAGYRFSNRLWSYDPRLNHWSQKASLPDSGLREPAVAVVDSFAYIFGVHHFIDNINDESTSAVWRYNAIQDRWDMMPPMPSARAGAVAYAFKNFIIVSFGEYESSSRLIWSRIKTDMLKFDLTSHQWSSISYSGTVLPSGFSTSFQYGSKCYLYAGIYDSNQSRDLDMYEFDATPLGPVYAGVEELAADIQGLRVYPNPISKDQGFTVESTETGVISFYNTLGQLLHQSDLSIGLNIFDCLHLGCGSNFLFYKADMQTGKSFTGKLSIIK